ncbi:IS1548, transposase [Streptococcus anginosus subsp. whileyi CCUG 39159]|uniref:IS1548, transposase n=2 Tax=Streptococcus anginosus group TaxID=671232 RepID=F9P4J8_STRCV|nr:IS1548, transposase [Streptococcus constellatus subsp. pharyngis SK1060 = CCUG 46377]EID22772.1 IS1548, transposase [Streptococcus anginosus subsp. whileyi CCUG 39159]BAN62254.1 hypothetical protein ANG_1784 [Streptococcus anginosus subsp. whileyi MAS624]GAD45453.1 hypothetical protein ANG5_1981 [Streptococcus constellatus subsp. pharyngis SK1060 = CCUG 46377]
MTRNRIERDGELREEVRYFIFSFNAGVEEFARCVRGHWQVESLHWLLDVIYREDGNRTLNKEAAANLNALRKICLYFLKQMNFSKPNRGYRRKMHYVASRLDECIQQLMRLEEESYF